MMDKSKNRDLASFMMRLLCSGECCVCPIYGYETDDKCEDVLAEIFESDENSEFGKILGDIINDIPSE